MANKTITALGFVLGLAVPQPSEALTYVPCQKPAQLVQLAPKRERITVKTGETLWEIARREYGTAWAYGALMITNSITDPRTVRAGQELVVYRSGVEEKLLRTGYIETVCPVTEAYDSPRRMPTEVIYTWDG